MLKIKIYFIIFIILLLLISCKIGEKKPTETFTVKKGDFLMSITETGELDAVNSNIIFAPPVSWELVSTLKIVKLVEDGGQVEKGDVIVEFNRSEIEKALESAKAELEIARADLRKTKANQQSRLEELTSDLETAKLDLNISQLRLQLKKFESEVDRKSIELELKKASIFLEKAEQEIKNQKSIDQEEINILELKINQAKNKLDDAEKTLKMLTVTAPDRGIAIIQRNPMTGNKFQIEDQTWSGYSLIGLPDLSLMRVNVPINEVDVAKVDTAQKAIIKLDAFPDTIFNGHISEIATLARTKDRESKIKVFDVGIIVDEIDKRLMPGMTVKCEIIVGKILDTLFIPLDALFHKEGKNIVYIKNNDAFEIREVKVGPENDNFVVITEGLKEGDVIALSEPYETKQTK